MSTIFTLEKFENRPLADRVADNIIKYILDNKLEAGDKIPNEFELGERLGVGRSTVREAIKILVSKNVLEIKRGAGTFISDKRGIADDPLGLTFVEDKYNLAMDLSSVRLMIEPEIAALAASNITTSGIKELEEQCNRVEELINSGVSHIEEDIKLHECIARMSGNIVVDKLIPIINSSIAIFIDMTDGSLKEETITTHREIVEAICNGDPYSAKYAMTMHLVLNRRRIIALNNKAK